MPERKKEKKNGQNIDLIGVYFVIFLLLTA